MQQSRPYTACPARDHSLNYYGLISPVCVCVCVCVCVTLIAWSHSVSVCVCVCVISVWNSLHDLIQSACVCPCISVSVSDTHCMYCIISVNHNPCVRVSECLTLVTYMISFNHNLCVRVCLTRIISIVWSHSITVFVFVCFWHAL